jgi:CTP:phosphocholine cytidylyltransferase-like protein
MGIPVEVSDDWCLYTDKNGIVIKETVGGTNCHQMVGISYWDAEAGAKLANDMDEVFRSPGGKERYWEQVPMHYKKENYKISIRECTAQDIVEIDSYKELKQIDPLYAD